MDKPSFIDDIPTKTSIKNESWEEREGIEHSWLKNMVDLIKKNKHYINTYWTVIDDPTGSNNIITILWMGVLSNIGRIFGLYMGSSSEINGAKHQQT